MFGSAINRNFNIHLHHCMRRGECFELMRSFIRSNRGEWLWSLANFKGANGVAKIYLELTFAAVPNIFFVFIYTVWITYETLFVVCDTVALHPYEEKHPRRDRSQPTVFVSVSLFLLVIFLGGKLLHMIALCVLSKRTKTCRKRFLWAL